MTYSICDFCANEIETEGDVWECQDCKAPMCCDCMTIEDGSKELCPNCSEVEP